ncbi:SMP-30/gluconolactonase/LRE family protein [Sphingomonas immobilis]|uniref:SMP-30/gluconolactonase/LRE family protein n=1 Tax=Sphingomonas immobilis TaxID=3063997 RepID=A0ABT9A1C5_9SPHN|nr:SMP-30/gluconolactonase/LRE family protein [Sphingomonas sp. CA1-15]MDO7843610.1 SMP-30/gluconolactonase/LRE family protein [Sphingomonas sp. CA1-15]
MRFRTLTEGLSFAEGPVATQDGKLLCVEVLAGRLTAISPDGETRLVAQLGKGPNGAAIGLDGRCYVANNGGLSRADLACLAAGKDGDLATPPAGCVQVVDLETGSFDTLYDRCKDVPLIAPNDLVFDRAGGFYFTDYGNLRQATPARGRIYYANPDGSSVRDLGHDLERPNGVGLSPDGKILYVSETSTGMLWGFPVAAPGILGDRALIFQDASLAMDSLAVQADGRICVACPHNDLVVRVSPSGEDERFTTPAQGPSNICFGGADMRTAYVTCLQAGVVLIAEWDTPGLRLPHQLGQISAALQEQEDD